MSNERSTHLAFFHEKDETQVVHCPSNSAVGSLKTRGGSCTPYPYSVYGPDPSRYHMAKELCLGCLYIYCNSNLETKKTQKLLEDINTTSIDHCEVSSSIHSWLFLILTKKKLLESLLSTHLYHFLSNTFGGLRWPKFEVELVVNLYSFIYVLLLLFFWIKLGIAGPWDN